MSVDEIRERAKRVVAEQMKMVETFRCRFCETPIAPGADAYCCDASMLHEAQDRVQRAEVVMREVDKLVQRMKRVKVGHYFEISELGDLLLAVQRYRGGSAVDPRNRASNSVSRKQRKDGFV